MEKLFSSKSSCKFWFSLGWKDNDGWNYLCKGEQYGKNKKADEAQSRWWLWWQKWWVVPSIPERQAMGRKNWRSCFTPWEREALRYWRHHRVCLSVKFKLCMNAVFEDSWVLKMQCTGLRTDTYAFVDLCSDYSVACGRWKQSHQRITSVHPTCFTLWKIS